MTDEDDASGGSAASTHPADRRRRPGSGGPETALVVGADTPTGRASALGFREEGWRVYATAGDEDAVADLAEHGCLTDGVDVTDDAAVRRIVERATREAGRVDCLALAGGRSLFGPVADVDVEAARVHLDHGLLGPYRLVRRVLPHMREAGDGTVVAVSSALGRLGAPGTGAYGAAAAGRGALWRSLRGEVGDDGVDVVTVEPALVDADREAAAWPEDTDYGWVYDLLAGVRSLADGGPGVASPEQVGAAVVNAASATAPAPRYPVGAAADALAKARYLPESWQHLLYGAVRRTAGGR
jgi:NAD(P)-dependent dehydrogenase (short-subunit alcohol dehydrogenase family)